MYYIGEIQEIYIDRYTCVYERMKIQYIEQKSGRI